MNHSTVGDSMNALWNSPIEDLRLILGEERQAELEAAIQNAGTIPDQPSPDFVGGFVRNLLQSAEPKLHPEMGERCARVLTFDQTLYDSVLTKYVANPPLFEEFVKQPGVEAVPRTKG